MKTRVCQCSSSHSPHGVIQIVSELSFSWGGYDDDLQELTIATASNNSNGISIITTTPDGDKMRPLDVEV